MTYKVQVLFEVLSENGPLKIVQFDWMRYRKYVCGTQIRDDREKEVDIFEYFVYFRSIWSTWNKTKSSKNCLNRFSRRFGERFLSLPFLFVTSLVLPAHLWFFFNHAASFIHRCSSRSRISKKNDCCKEIDNTISSSESETNVFKSSGNVYYMKIFIYFVVTLRKI